MKVVFGAGIYDLFHKGHINLLKKMRDEGDIVVSVIHDDTSCYEIKGKIPVQRLEQRVMNLLRSGLVDGVVITRSVDPALEFERVLDRYKDCEIVYMRGDDLTGNFPGKWLLLDKGVEIKYVPYTKGVSSTELKEELMGL